MNDICNTTPALTFDNRLYAKFLYWMGWQVNSIAEFLKENDKTVHSWKARDEWDKNAPACRIAEALNARLVMLILKPSKSAHDFKEIDCLMRQVERLARVDKYLDGGNEADLNPNLKKRNDKPKKPVLQNALTQDQIDKLLEDFDTDLFDYQKVWYRHADQRNRILLKSRQIGATFYFAREALIKAITSGRNQIFISASKAQAHAFKGYIKDFVMRSIEVELKGDPIVITLPNNESVRLFFLGTNFRTAQSYSGDLYFDEFFWVHGFNQLKKVASGMATQKIYKKTYFSTPSSKTHEAYKFWTGEAFNKGRTKDKRVEFDVSHNALVNGALCGDRTWRHIVNIYDAERQGCDLFDIEELIDENSTDEFTNLYMCEFMDDGHSMFPLATLQPLMVDSWELWDKDFKPQFDRPFANKEVWLGYDPAETGDSAGLVAVAPPDANYPKFRVLEKRQFKDQNFQSQAEQIKKMCEKYRVTYIGMDTTGMGTGVAQLVRNFFPALTTFSYSPEVKTLLVMKGLEVVQDGRLEFDASHVDIALSLMSIKKTMTGSGRQFTFEASRSEETGHADLAWALLHVLHNEPLGQQKGAKSGKSRVEIY